MRVALLLLERILSHLCIQGWADERGKNIKHGENMCVHTIRIAYRTRFSTHFHIQAIRLQRVWLLIRFDSA